jgi:hypothetical protein
MKEKRTVKMMYPAPWQTPPCNVKPTNFTASILHTHPGLAERFADVEISLCGHHHDTVDTASESHLGEGEDDGGGVRLDSVAVAGGEGRQAVQEEHSTLKHFVLQGIVLIVQSQILSCFAD